MGLSDGRELTDVIDFSPPELPGANNSCPQNKGPAQRPAPGLDDFHPGEMKMREGGGLLRADAVCLPAKPALAVPATLT